MEDVCCRNCNRGVRLVAYDPHDGAPLAPYRCLGCGLLPTYCGCAPVPPGQVPTAPERLQIPAVRQVDGRWCTPEELAH